MNLFKGKGEPAGSYQIFSGFLPVGFATKDFQACLFFFVWMAGMEGQVEEDTFVVLVGFVADG